ncbi:hypothetical protein Sste5344_003829 [Sporothrix stenoceras]
MQLLAAIISFLLLVSAETVGPKCSPVTWSKEKRGEHQAHIGDAQKPKFTPRKGVISTSNVAVGDVNCRYDATTGSKVSSATCAELAKKYGIREEVFFKLNPSVLPDCSNIGPDTDYCVAGSAQCCNSETWTCGKTEEDCSRGICYEGACAGDKVYSTDGTCGVKDGRIRQCAGKHGNCCNNDGKCGTGEAFCGLENCQGGDCVKPEQKDYKPGAGTWLGGNTTDGTCGGTNKFTCNVVYGNCCNKDNICGSNPSDCEAGCQPEWGMCKGAKYTPPSGTETSDKPMSTITYQGLPECGKSCMMHMLVQSTSLECGLPRAPCLCSNDVFLIGLAHCAHGICYNETMAETVIGYWQAYCFNETTTSTANAGPLL